MNVYDEMNNLCKAIKESHEYKVLVEAKGKLATDSSAESMVKDFLKQKQELEIAQYQGQKPDDAKVKKMQDLYNVLQLNPVAGEYIQAYIRFQMMFGDLSKTLSDTLKEVHGLMTMSGLLSFLEERLPGKFQINAPMERYTTFRVGGPADLLVEPETREEVCSLLREIHTQQVPLTVIGNGSNLLVLDKGIRGCVVKLGSCLKQLTIQGCTIRVEAGVLLSRLASAAAEGGLAGLEFASGIPGSLGGAILMNAGAYGGEIGNLVRSVTVADGGGELRTLNREEMEFRYRHSAVMDSGDIILGATLELTRDDPDAIRERISELTRKRVSKQPLNFPSAGSTFKRPPGYFAAALIDQAGLRGYRVGDAQVSEKHTGFVVNRGHATASEILQLMDDVREKVHAMSGVWLEPEVRIIGEK